AKHADRPVAQITQAELACVGNCAGGLRSSLEVLVEPAERVGEVAVGSQITSGESKARIKLAKALAGDHILAGEKASAPDILCADRYGWQPTSFFPKPDLEVYGLVFVILIAAQLFWAIAKICDIRVAIHALEPREGLHRHVVACVGRCMADSEGELA